MRSGAGMDSETSGAWAPGTPFSVYRPFRRPAAGAARALRHVGLLLVVAGAAAGCAATATEPAFIPVPPRAGPRPAARPAARDIRDYPTALAAIADVLDEDFGLPRPAGTLVVFPSRDAFAAGLLTIGYDPELARRSADAFRAIGGATGVLLNESSLRGARWADRVQLLAHELVHGVQYAFANGVRGTSEQWLREGFAEIVSMRVTETLGFGHYQHMREGLVAPLADVRRGTLPVSFRRLSTFPDWAAAQSREPVPVYAQAFVAAELLLERHGLKAMVEYFRLFGTSMDKDANFALAFGRSLEDFDREFLTHWPQALAQVR